MAQDYWTVTDEEMAALRTAEELLKKLRVAQLTADRVDELQRSCDSQRKHLNAIAFAFMSALHIEKPESCCVPEAWLYEPMPEAVARLAKQRDDALALVERVKTLAQIAVGPEPGERILAHVAELQGEIERLKQEKGAGQ